MGLVLYNLVKLCFTFYNFKPISHKTLQYFDTIEDNKLCYYKLFKNVDSVRI